MAALVLGVLLLGILVRALGIGGTRAKVEDPLPALYDVNPATELTTAGGVDSAEDRCGSCRID